MQAFADGDYAVTMAVGNAIDVTSLGETPDNFVVRQFVPQLEVLNHADVFFTHGGMGGVHEALSYGVPMVLYPQMVEQSIVARQIASLGAGVQLTSVGGASGLTSNELLSSVAIRDAVDSVMHNPRFARNARRLGYEFPANTPVLFADIVSGVVNRGARQCAA